MRENEKTVNAEELLEEIKLAIKDLFVATVRKHGDELKISFPGGQTFSLTVWEEKQNGS